MHSIPKKRDSEDAHSAREAHDDKQEYHPCCCSVPRGVHPGPHWQCISTLHVKARCLDYKNELCHVHSQLLLIFHLVQVPLPTYMLKFSRFAGQTSGPRFNIPSAQPIMSVHMRKSGKPIGHRASRVRCNALTRHACAASTGWNTQHGCRHESSPTSGISQSYTMRSNGHWFTEICNSQCVSHFAASLIAT